MNLCKASLCEAVSFNRYMVECESSTAMLTEFVDFCFNRYMVECESLNIFSSFPKFLVLIDTWWNVNEWYNVYKANYFIVLIDTWWNVNFQRLKSPQMRQTSFNRYMVECELRAIYLPTDQRIVLIDTWWNVNKAYEHEYMGIPVGF